MGRSEGVVDRPRASDGVTFPAERPVGWFGRCVMEAFRACVRFGLRLLFRVRIENRPRISGGYIVVANHSSFLDPILVGATMPRPVVFLMTVLHFRSAWLGWFYRWHRAIPLALRDSNRDALRAARKVLQRGEVLGVFPEGGLSRDGGLLLGNPGAVSLVMAEDVPVVPCWIEGADRALPLGGRLRLRKVVVRFGEPISHAALVDPGSGGGRRARLRAATRTIMDRIAALGGVESREAVLDRLRHRADAV